MNHLLEKLAKLANSFLGTSVGHTVKEAHVMLADFKDEGAEEAVRAMKAMQFKFTDGQWVPPAKIDHRSTIYTQAYDADGKRVVSGVRSSSDPQRDCRVMDAAIELYYAGAVRKQDNITPHVLWRHVMGESWPAERKEVAAVDTLHGLGFTHTGGVLWKPPLGKPPRTRAELRDALQIAAKYTQWMESRDAKHVTDALEASKQGAQGGPVPKNYTPLYEFALKNKVSYNELCAAVVESNREAKS